MPTVDDADLPAAPNHPWLALFAVALSLTIALLAAGEMTFRATGTVRTPSDDAHAWTQTRARLRDGDRRQIVLLGDSRMQCDVAPEVLAAELACDAPLQLACGGATPIPALRHVAEETEFSGIVLCNVIPYFFFNPNFFSGGAQQEYINAWKAQASGLRAVRSQIDLCRDELTVRHAVVEWRVQAHAGAKPYWRMLPDRSIENDFRFAKNLGQLCSDWSAGALGCPEPPISETALSEELAAYEGWVQQIQRRGGLVVFVRLP